VLCLDSYVEYRVFILVLSVVLLVMLSMVFYGYTECRVFSNAELGVFIVMLSLVFLNFY